MAWGHEYILIIVTEEEVRAFCDLCELWTSRHLFKRNYLNILLSILDLTENINITEHRLLRNIV